MCPSRTRHCPPGARLPESDSAVRAAAGQQLAVGRQRHAPDRAGVALQRRQRPPGARLPQPHRAIPAAAGQQPAVGGQRHAPRDAGARGPVQGRHGRPLPVSHSRTVPSSPPLASSPPSAESATP